MGGGGNFFSSVGNAVANAVGNTFKAFESAGQSVSALAKGDIGGATAKAINFAANSAGFNDVVKPYTPQSRTSQQSGQAEGKTQTTEGGTPTANAVQASKQAGASAAMSQSNLAANANAGSGTMLTGREGVDPQSLELGRQTLLGG